MRCSAKWSVKLHRSQVITDRAPARSSPPCGSHGRALFLLGVNPRPHPASLNSIQPVISASK